MGKLRPNIVMLGMKSNWKISEPEDVIDYFNTIQYDSFSLNLLS